MKKMHRLALLGGSKARTKPFKPHPVLGSEERKEVLSVLKTGLLSGFVAKAGDHFLGGPKVRELEKHFCDYFDVPYAVAMNSATSALHAAVSALEIGPGDEVLVPPYTMSATPAAVLMQSAIPVFVDIEEKGFCMDPDKIEAKITPRTKAILVVHLFGQPARMKEILEIAKRRRLFVIEDCAQAPGAKYEGRYAGTLGDIGVFSLNQHKTITTGEGGVAVTRDRRLALRMQLVRNHGEVVLDELKADVDPGVVLGWNYRMTELEGAVGIAQFKKLDKLNDHRIKLAEYLIRELKKISGITPAPVFKNGTHVYFVVPFHYEEKKVGLPRDLFVKALNAEGVPFGAGYVRPIYLDAIYRERRIYKNISFPFSSEVSYAKGDCPVAERMHFHELIVTGICRYPLTFSDMRDVVRAFRKVMNARKELLGGAKDSR